MKNLHLDLAERHEKLPCDYRTIRGVLERALEGAVEEAHVGVAVVGDEEISGLNARFLGREGPTDVMAFPYECTDRYVEGEIVINADRALRRAEETGHGPEDELLLYLVHGALHLVGYDDAEPRQRRRMHRRALEVLAGAGRELDSATLLEE